MLWKVVNSTSTPVFDRKKCVWYYESYETVRKGNPHKAHFYQDLFFHKITLIRLATVATSVLRQIFLFPPKHVRDLALRSSVQCIHLICSGGGDGGSCRCYWAEMEGFRSKPGEEAKREKLRGGGGELLCSSGEWKWREVKRREERIGQRRGLAWLFTDE